MSFQPRGGAPTYQEPMMQTAEQLVTFGQGNVEALVKSSQIFANGLQDISKLMAASAQTTPARKQQLMTP